jgi:hypothetical protein
MLTLVPDNIHTISCRACEGVASLPGAGVVLTRGAESTAAPAMGRSQHAAPMIDAIIDDEEVVVARKKVLVYTVQSALLWRTAEAIAIRN